MKSIHLLLILSIFAGISCKSAVSSADNTSFPPQSLPSIGLVIDQKDSDKMCFETRSSDLKKDDPVTIIGGIFFEPQFALKAKIDEKLEKKCSTKINGGFGSVDREDQSYYLIKMVGAIEETPGLSIAVANADGVPLFLGGKASMDIDGDGEMEFFRQCTGYEGVIYTVWTGEPLKGKQIWHRYFYLGYDTVPDCTDKDNEETEVEKIKDE